MEWKLNSHWTPVLLLVLQMYSLVAVNSVLLKNKKQKRMKFSICSVLWEKSKVKWVNRQRASCTKVLWSLLNIYRGKQGEVQRSRFGTFRLCCTVMDTRSSCSSVQNHRRIGGPRHCRRHNPQQRRRSCYYSAAWFLSRPPLYAAVLSQLAPSHTIPTLQAPLSASLLYVGGRIWSVSPAPRPDSSLNLP